MNKNFMKILTLVLTVAMLLLVFTGCAPAASAEGEGGGGGAYSIVMLLIMIVIFYFFLIRPENKKRKKQEEMRNALEVGDKITTIGGIVGKIVAINGELITFETGEDRVRLQVTKWAVSTNSVQKTSEESK